jgi:hypothetical protein
VALINAGKPNVGGLIVMRRAQRMFRLWIGLSTRLIRCAPQGKWVPVALDALHGEEAISDPPGTRGAIGCESARRDAVADVEVALAVERAAAAEVSVAQRRLDAAMAEFDMCADEVDTYRDLAAIVHEVELATQARLLAVSAEARGRALLVAAVAAFVAMWDSETETPIHESSRFPDEVRTAFDVRLSAPSGIALRPADPSAAAARVVVDPTAIAMRPDPRATARTRSSAIRAARTTKDAIRAAAVARSRAADAARAEQDAAALAAARLAAEAISVAIGVQLRAEHGPAAVPSPPV